jgi:hypothetical protein
MDGEATPRQQAGKHLRTVQGRELGTDRRDVSGSQEAQDLQTKSLFACACSSQKHQQQQPSGRRKKKAVPFGDGKA